MVAGVAVPIEALATLRRRLAAHLARHPQRSPLLSSTAELYAVSRATLYRLLRGKRRPRDAQRGDRGTPRVMPAAEIERWCEIIAAMKVRTTNRKGRHLSTVRILQLLVGHGVETPDGLQRLPPGRLTASTINRHMRRLGYDRDRMTRQSPEEAYVGMLKQSGLFAPLAELFADFDVGAAQEALFDDSGTFADLIGRPTRPIARTVADALAR